MTNVSSIIYNIKLNRMYIVQRLAENIAENMRRRFNYETHDYYRICVDVLQEIGLDRQYVLDLMHEVIEDAYEQNLTYKATGLFSYHNGCESHPYVVISKSAQDLVTLLQMFEGAAGNMRVVTEESTRKEVM